MSDVARERVKELFFAASELDGPQREAYLDEVCAGDSALREEVESLLAHDSAADDAFSDGELGLVRDALEDAVQSDARGGASKPNEQPHPTQIGRYRIVRLIGEGGMGLVYEARQDHPQRTVALKVIRPGLSSQAVLRRFRHEADVLGQLHHPGIAHIYDAGLAEVAVDDGRSIQQPYFAMEFVRGEPITTFAARREMGTRQKIELIAGVCDAMHHAHQKGVIHRDLKPANILVVHEPEADAPTAEPRSGSTFGLRSPIFPKILDFGVARITDADVMTVTLHTDVGQLVGTVPYMSPEQLTGDSSQVDARTDVYAIGVVLYELLANQLPHDVRGRPIPEAVRVIRDEEPSRLSSVNPLFRGDVETIVAKALEKEKDRRYQSAADLAADIRRYLNDEPIVARPASAVYQFRKFARRNKGFVAGLCGVVLALTLGVIGTTIGLVRARAAEQLAQQRLRESQRQTQIAEAVNEFLNDDLLSLADPENSPDRDLTLRAAIDAAAGAVEERFEGKPLIEAAVRVTLGRTYRNLAEYEQAETHLDRAIALREEELGADHNDTLKAVNHLAMLYDGRGRFDEAEALYRRVLDVRMRTLGPEHDDTLATMNNLGLTLADSGNYAAAEPLLQQVFDTRQRLHPPDHQDRLLSANNLASLYWSREQYAKALPLYEQTLDGRMRTLGPDHPQTLTSMDNLATCLVFLGRHEEAEKLTTEMLDRARRVLGPDHPRTVTALNNLGALYSRQGDNARAAPILRDVVATVRRTRAPGHWHLGAVLSNYGSCLRSLKEYEQAEAALLEAHAVLEAALGPSHDRTITVADLLVTLYEETEKPDKAARWRKKLAEAQKAPTP